MTVETEDKNRAKGQAKAQLESIVAMVKRLEHAQECDGEDCKLTDEEIFEGLSLFYKKGMTASEEERGQYHDNNAVREAIEEDPLSVQVRSGWYSPGETPETLEYEILLCTGGPAVRIIGELGRFNQPESAELQYQDWFTPWEPYSTNSEEDEALLTYTRQFHFGE